jgi:hydrogenase 3 maturation protease
MLALKTTLKKRLSNAKRVALLGVGSELRGDDAAGILVSGQLEKECRKISPKGTFRVFTGSTAPENLTGEIKRFKPDHLIIIDSADTGKKAGAIVLIDPERVSGVSFATHQLPMKILVDYLIKSIGCKISIIGIQSKRLDFGSSPSKEIQKSVRIISDTLKDIISRRK